jgi:hypothetical protein
MTGRQTIDESQLFALGAFAAPVTHPRAALADIRGAPAAGGHRRSACWKWPLRKPAISPRRLEGWRRIIEGKAKPESARTSLG